MKLFSVDAIARRWTVSHFPGVRPTRFSSNHRGGIARTTTTRPFLASSRRKVWRVRAMREYRGCDIDPLVFSQVYDCSTPPRLLLPTSSGKKRNEVKLVSQVWFNLEIVFLSSKLDRVTIAFPIDITQNLLIFFVIKASFVINVAGGFVRLPIKYVLYCGT